MSGLGDGHFGGSPLHGSGPCPYTSGGREARVLGTEQQGGLVEGSVSLLSM